MDDSPLRRHGGGVPGDDQRPPLALALLLPFVFPVFHYVLLNSTFATLRHGGIRWHETF